MLPISVPGAFSEWMVLESPARTGSWGQRKEKLGRSSLPNSCIEHPPLKLASRVTLKSPPLKQCTAIKGHLVQGIFPLTSPRSDKAIKTPGRFFSFLFWIEVGDRSSCSVPQMKVLLYNVHSAELSAYPSAEVN